MDLLFFIILLPMACMVLVTYCIVAVGSYYVAERRILIYALSVAAKKQVPLQEIAHAISLESKGPSAWKARRLSELLDQGVPFPDALQGLYRNLPNEVRVAAICGWEMDCLGTALEMGLESQNALSGIARQATLKVVYILLVLLLMAGILLWTIVNLLPAFIDMFEEFGLELPAMTMYVVLAVEALSQFWYLTIPVGLLMGLVGLVFLAFVSGLLPTRWLLGGRLTFARDRAMVLQALAMGIQCGWPITRTLEVLSVKLAVKPPSKMIGKRLNRIYHEMNDGVLWIDCLARQKLINTRERDVLAAAHRSGNAEWALREVAHAILRRRLQRVQVFYNTALPLTILLLGAVVGTIVVTFFFPLVEMIRGMV